MGLSGSGQDGACTSDALHQAICNLVAGGVPVVVAAGNAAQDAATSVPAAYDEVITVSAFADFDGKPGGTGSATCSTNDRDDRFASFSNYGADVDIAAPGRCVRSTTRGGGTGLMSGTSMAAPHVAGAAALYRAEAPGACPPAGIDPGPAAASTQSSNASTGRVMAGAPGAAARTPVQRRRRSG